MRRETIQLFNILGNDKRSNLIHVEFEKDTEVEVKMNP